MALKPEILKTLAAGGQGTLFLARLPDREGKVVIKRRRHDRPADRERFDHEIAMLAALDHPNVVPLLDRGSDEHGPWYAMPRADGGTLQGAAVRPDGLAPLLYGLLRALRHAHARGILHLDLSPGNVLLHQGHPWLADFGGGLLQGHARRTRIGTPAFMAPECFEAGGDVGPWSDLYALGAVAWTVLAGRPPHDGTDWSDLHDAHAHAPLPALEHPLGPWLTRLLARAPADRPRSAGAALELLEPLLPAPSRPCRAPHRPSLRLLGLRRPALVGRHGPLSTLERSLAGVTGGTPAAVLVRGPSGCGKSHLVQHFAQSSAELRGTTVLFARHDPLSSGGTEGLGGMVASFLRCADPDDEAERHRLRAALGRLGSVRPAQLGRVRELLVGGGEPERRHRSLAELLRTLPGPVLVTLDDVQWGAEGLHFVRWALRQPALPVLFVLVTQTEALAERPAEAALLRELTATPIALGPLERPHHGALVDAFLPLEPALRRDVQRHTRGDPLFTDQLLRAWGTMGLDRARSRDWPPTLDALWARQLDRIGARPALELASVLGAVVEAAPWRELASTLGLDLPESLVPDLVDSGLAVRHVDHDGRWGFVHGSLRAHLQRSARAAGRLDRLHRACARHFTHDPRRAARHWIALDDWCRAFAPLLRALWSAVQAGDVPAVEELVRLCDQAASRVEAPDPRLVRYALLRALHEQSRGDRDAKQQWVARADAGSLPDHERALRHYLHGATTLTDGQIDEAATAFAAALHAARPEDPVHLRAQIALGMAEIRRGRPAEGRAALLRAHEGCRAAGDAAGRMRCSFGLANAAVQLGDLARAEHHVDTAREAAEAAGSARGLAECDNYYGEISRQQGELALAEQHYRAALSALREIDPEEAWVARVNLASALLQQGRTDEARPHFEAVHAWARDNAALLATAAAAGMLGCLADGGSEADWQHWQAEMTHRVQTSTYVEIDLAQLLDLAKDRAERAGTPARAEAAGTLAAQLWRRLEA